MRRAVLTIALWAVCGAAQAFDATPLLQFVTAGSTWTPTSLSGLVMWLDATQETAYTNGADVTQWTDRSGRGNHATNGAVTYASMDTDGMNSKRAILFTPVGNSLAGMYAPSLGLAVSNITIFSAIAANDEESLEAYRIIISLNQHANGLWGGLYVRSDRRRGDFYNNSSGAIGTNQSWLATRGLTEITIKKSSIKGLAIRQDGSHYATNTTAGAQAAYTEGATQIGGMSAGLASAKTWNGLMGEIIIYNRELTDAEVLTVEAYIKTKWGTP